MPAPARPLVVERDTARLVVRCVPAGRVSDQALLLLEETVRELPAEALAPLGLGRRESEVLTCLCRGSSNPEMAALLGISPRTVEKHLERIYRKLGVQGRTQAAAKALHLARAAAAPEEPGSIDLPSYPEQRV